MTLIRVVHPDGMAELVEADTSSWKGTYGAMTDYTQAKHEYDIIDREERARARLAPTIIPSDGRIVVEPFEEHQTPSGIILPTIGAAERRSTIGKVVALPGYIFEELSDEQRGEHIRAEIDGIEYDGLLRIGDIVLFGQNSGMLIDIGYGAGRRRAIILRESEVLAKVTWPTNE